jgi:hypothetical protein
MPIPDGRGGVTYGAAIRGARSRTGTHAHMGPAGVCTLSSSLSASPALYFFNLVQYDNRTRNLGWQARVRWTLRPGSDLYGSFHQGWIQNRAEYCILIGAF